MWGSWRLCTEERIQYSEKRNRGGERGWLASAQNLQKGLAYLWRKGMLGALGLKGLGQRRCMEEAWHKEVKHLVKEKKKLLDLDVLIKLDNEF